MVPAIHLRIMSVMQDDKVMLSPASRSDRVWRAAQVIVMLSGAVLVAVLTLQPSLGLAFMWNMLIPVAPALVVLAPGLWRNICPMASLSLLPLQLGWSRRRKLTRRQSSLLGLASFAGLLVVVPLRHLLLDTDGPSTAAMLVTAGIAAFAMGLIFDRRAGWCASLCPIHPVERLYGMAPVATSKNRRCESCTTCTALCPDSIPSMSAVVTSPSVMDRRLGQALAGGFAGFIWGWYQTPDYQGAIGLAEILSCYLWPLAGATVTLALYLLAGRWFSRRILVRFFAAAAVSAYYWFRLPALIGFGRYEGTGRLLDLRGAVPGWVPVLLSIAAVAFFMWFLVLRACPKRSWMSRPSFEAAE